MAGKKWCSVLRWSKGKCWFPKKAAKLLSEHGKDGYQKEKIKGIFQKHKNNRISDMETINCYTYAAAAAKLLQSCPALYNPIDSSPIGSPVPGILQARTLEWVAISFSSAWKWKVKVKSLSCVWLFAIPWTAAYQAPLSMGFSRQDYWSGVPSPSLCYTYTKI